MSAEPRSQPPSTDSLSPPHPTTTTGTYESFPSNTSSSRDSSDDSTYLQQAATKGREEGDGEVHTSTSGYLDEGEDRSEERQSGIASYGSSTTQNTGLNPHSLLTHLASRQYASMPRTSSEYESTSQWHHVPSSSSRRKRTKRSSKGQTKAGTKSNPRYANYDSEYETDSTVTQTTSASSGSTDSSSLQREWEQQLDQLKLMFQIVILPFAGKFLGRKWSYWRTYPPSSSSSSPPPPPFRPCHAVSVEY